MTRYAKTTVFILTMALLLVIGLAWLMNPNAEAAPGDIDESPVGTPPITFTLTGDIENHYEWLESWDRDGNWHGEWVFHYQLMRPSVGVDGSDNWADAGLDFYFWSKSDLDMTTTRQGGVYDCTLNQNGDASWSLPWPEDPLLKGVWRTDRDEPNGRWRYCRELGFLRLKVWHRLAGSCVYDSDWKMFTVVDVYD